MEPVMEKASNEIYRAIDTAGRVVLPKDMREQFQLDTGSEVGISVVPEGILITPHKKDGCEFCKDEFVVEVYRGKQLCHRCLTEIKKL